MGFVSISIVELTSKVVAVAEEVAVLGVEDERVLVGLACDIHDHGCVGGGVEASCCGSVEEVSLVEEGWWLVERLHVQLVRCDAQVRVRAVVPLVTKDDAGVCVT